MSEALLSILVVTVRRWDLLRECLESVRAAGQALNQPTELVVVENDSTPESCARIAEHFPEARVIALRANAGFAGAFTPGFEATQGDWIVVLNDDVTVAPSALLELMSAAETASDIGAVSPQIRFADRPGTINCAGIELDRLAVAADRLVGMPIEASESRPVEVFGVSSTAAAYRRSMLDQIGGFDESFFAYLDDVDVAWRARMCGWRSLYAPDAIAYHRHSATFSHRSSQKLYLTGRNRLRLLAKNATRGQLLRGAVGMVLYDIAYVAYVAATAHTLAPLKGRIEGAREWRHYRRSGASLRSPIELAPPFGLRRALRRNRAWAR